MIMKKILLTLFLSVVMAIPSFARSFNFTYEGQEFEFTEVLDGSPNPRVYVSDFLSEDVTDVVIPRSFMNGGLKYTVTGIAEAAFQGGNFKTIVMPNSVLSIGYNAFEDCQNLNSVTFSRGLQTIESGAFQNCSSLTSVSIPNTVEEIGGSAFWDCPLESVILEEGSNNIKCLYAFPMTPIKNLYIGRPHSTQLIESYKSTLETLTLGNCVKEVLDKEFMDFENLKSVTFGSNIKTIGEFAFKGCKNLTKVILSPTVEVIKEGAFANTSITEIAMGYAITTIAKDAFSGCPVESVAITAPEPPAVGENIFSNLDFKLMVEGEKAKEKYAASPNLWSRLECELLVEPSLVKYDGPDTIKGWQYEVYDLSATIEPEDVVYPTMFWDTSDPEVATVTTDGVVTIQPGISEMYPTTYIKAGTLYVNTKRAVNVKLQFNKYPSGIDEVISEEATVIDYSAPYAVYGLDGRLAGNSTEGLAKGIYIIRQGEVAKKILVTSER